MLCRLCLLESNKSILIFSEEIIQKHITKFLQLKLTPEDPISNVICSTCLKQLEDFKNFYFRVEEAQKSLSSAQEKVKKEDALHVSNVAVSVDVVPFIRINTDSNFNELKEEDSSRDSDDESHANSELLTTLHEDDVVVKVEESNVELPETSNSAVPESSEPAVTRRITRGSTVNKPITPEKTLAEGILKRKRGRPKKEASVEEPTADAETYTKDIEGKADDCPPEQNEKRRRGRPKKGEERPKVEKIRSEKCEKILKTAKEFDEIIQKHMNLVCNICCVSLIDFAELKRHFRAVHNRKGYAVCCNKRLYKRGLVVDHINTHNNPEYFKCKECGKVMADRMCLRNHMLLMHQNEEEKMFQCSYCPKKYAKQYLLDHHRVKHIPKEECTFFCAECDRGFPTKTTLTKHLNQIHSTVYDKMCEICAKLIRGNAAFERHMDEHEGIVRPQVQCKICGSWLKDKNSLRKHMYKHDGKSYTCNECGKVAPSKSALQSHLRYVHQTLRQFHCTFCDKSFKKAVNLREHLTTHTGEVLYTCPHCPKTFNSKANMHAHRKKKHREEWEANRRYNVKQASVTETNSN